MLLSSDDIINKYAATLCTRSPSLTFVRTSTHVHVHPRMLACRLHAWLACASLLACRCLCVVAHIVQYTPVTDTCSPHTHTHTHTHTCKHVHTQTRAYVQAHVSANASYAHTHEHTCMLVHVVRMQTHAYLVQHAFIFLFLCSASMGPPPHMTCILLLFPISFSFFALPLWDPQKLRPRRRGR